MCQYSNRCPVGKHRLGTRCQYVRAPRSTRTYVQPSPQGRAIAPSRRARPSRKQKAALGFDGFSFLVAAALVWGGDPGIISTRTFMFALMLVLLPLGFGLWLTKTCTVWNQSTEGRCGRTCYGPKRCGIPAHRRSVQFLTEPEFVALVSVFCTILNFCILASAAF